VVLQRAHELRDTIYRVFSQLAAHGRPAQSELQMLIEASGKAIAQANLVWRLDHFCPDWTDVVELEGALWPVAYSAGALLCSATLSRVKACPGCQWLFLDESKNQSRRWCNMQTCGTRDKMRRYHQLGRAKQMSNRG
jgi:predicted RNA-binding Zn ribbon-like protein